MVNISRPAWVQFSICLGAIGGCHSTDIPLETSAESPLITSLACGTEENTSPWSVTIPMGTYYLQKDEGENSVEAPAAIILREIRNGSAAQLEVAISTWDPTFARRVSEMVRNATLTALPSKPVLGGFLKALEDNSQENLKWINEASLVTLDALFSKPGDKSQPDVRAHNAQLALAIEAFSGLVDRLLSKPPKPALVSINVPRRGDVAATPDNASMKTKFIVTIFEQRCLTQSN